jgi:hypothetical protein
MIEVGDLIKYRRVDVEASSLANHRSGVWVDHLGLIISTSPRTLRSENYFVRVFFPSLSRVRTLRASRVSKVL